MMTRQEEIAAVMEIMRQTNDSPEERERRLAELARRESNPTARNQDVTDTAPADRGGRNGNDVQRSKLCV